MLSVTDHLSFDEESQTVGIEDRKAQYAHQENRKQVSEEYFTGQVFSFQELFQCKQWDEEDKVNDTDDKHDFSNFALKLLVPVSYDIGNEGGIIWDFIFVKKLFLINCENHNSIGRAVDLLCAS